MNKNQSYVLSKEQFIETKNILNETIRNLSESDEIIKFKQFNCCNNGEKSCIDEILLKADENNFIKKNKNDNKYAFNLKKYVFIALAGTILFQFLLVAFLIFGVINKIFNLGEAYRFFFIIVGENFAQILILSYLIIRLLFNKDK
ncbi:MAG: hypothetical protein PHZ26_03240 [Candidatus Gracilibacteria bacterium]|nr:hypothetical protein [Candidatus Gracilibacteria bacterium]MDD2908742.1 hypothetical protein [Candidatus Gracilibacteria bacterium]